MKDVINPGALSITGDVEENRLTSGQLRLGALEVRSGGHGWFLCVDVIIVAGSWSVVEWVGPVLNLSIGDVAVTVQHVNVHGPGLPK